MSKFVTWFWLVWNAVGLVLSLLVAIAYGVAGEWADCAIFAVLGIASAIGVALMIDCLRMDREIEQLRRRSTEINEMLGRLR